MNADISAASWVAQSPERIAAVRWRSAELLRRSEQDHFRRLMAEWAASEEDPIPSRAQASRAAQHELEVLCRGLGRLGALSPHEVFPEQIVVTSPHEDGGW